MELIYNIQDIFSAEEDGVLAEIPTYYIPTYQRGYKWQTEQVEQLLDDIWEAFISKEEQYFLQYLTIKELSVENKKVWEVIDGQQRLTTLSILFAALGREDTIKDLAAGKITYAIREDLLEVYIREKLQGKESMNWTAITEEGEIPDRQDLYYMHNTMRVIRSFLEEKKVKNASEDFYRYLTKNVCLILNVVNNVSGEEVFENMNSNKKPLTDIELVKALLLTLKAREAKNKTFHEILEQRAIDGIHWDEVSRWINDKKIKHFYGSDEKDGLEIIMKLLVSKASGQFPLFNAIHKELKASNSKASLLFDAIKLQKGVLEKWYRDKEVYNLLGFVFFSKIPKKQKTSKIEILKGLENETRSQVISTLRSKRADILRPSHQVTNGKVSLDHIQHGEHDDNIRNIMLAVNVFFSEDSIKDARFDFYSYTKNNWDIEHIFPKNPANRKEEERVLYQWDKDILEKLGLFDNLSGNEDDCKDIISLQTELEKLNTQEIVKLNQTQTKVLSTLIDKSKHFKTINGLGNLCLLPDSVNRSIGNKMFYDKREAVVGHIAQGRFVPKASFGVFSKTICKDLDKTLEKWTLADIAKYKQELETRFKLLISSN